jgi:hypothetical protein
VPAEPSGLQNRIVSEGVELSWTASTDAETAASGLTYNLYLLQGADTLIMPNSHWDGTRKLATPGNVQHNRSVVLKLEPYTYTWSVQAIDKSFGGGPFAKPQQFNMPALGVEEEGASVQLYPNPTDDALHFSVTRPVELSVYNGEGKRMLDVRVEGEGKIDVSTWSAGIYLVRGQSAGKQFVQKIVKR